MTEVYYNWRYEQLRIQVAVPNKIARRITILRRALKKRKQS